MVRGTCKIFEGQEVINALKEGSRKTASAVGTTFGPYGKNVGITYTYNLPHITKDGVTVANNINLECPMENVSAQIMRHAARKTADVAGDGTTSTIILTNQLVQRYFDLIVQGHNPFWLKRHVEEESERIIAEIIASSKVVENSEDILNIALVASNGDKELSELVTNAFDKIGKDGIVTLIESRSYNTTIDVVDGIKLDRGHIDPALNVTNDKVIHLQPRILVTDFDLTTVEDALHLINMQEASEKPLIVICNDIHRGALEALVYNKTKRGSLIEVIRAPFISEARREAIQDLAIATGATAIIKDGGWSLKTISLSNLGSAESVEITSKETNIIGRLGKPEAIAKRVEYYNTKIEEDIDGLADNYRKRLALLTAGAAVIYIGGTNEIEIAEKRDRLDDTIKAVKAALEQGVVTGGACSYVTKSIRATTHKAEIEKILHSSLRELSTRLRDEVSLSFEDWEKSMLDSKIIDPTLVVISTIRNAVGAAAMIYTTDCLVVKNEE